MGCLKYASVSILVNGSLINEFKTNKRLRQGDPLIPFFVFNSSEKA